MSQSTIPLHMLNAHLFSQLMPNTHGDAPAQAAEKPKRGKATKPAVVETPAPDAGPQHREYTADEIALLAQGGVADPLARTPEEIAAILVAMSVQS